MASKYAVKAIDGDDLMDALKAIETQTGCKARIIIKMSGSDELAIRVEAYTENQDVRVGVATDTIWWSIGNGKVLGRALVAIHRVYAQAYDLAHSTTYNRTLRKASK